MSSLHDRQNQLQLELCDKIDAFLGVEPKSPKSHHARLIAVAEVLRHLLMAVRHNLNRTSPK